MTKDELFIREQNKHMKAGMDMIWDAILNPKKVDTHPEEKEQPCAFCNGEGVVQVMNGPDDFETTDCLCQTEDRDDVEEHNLPEHHE